MKIAIIHDFLIKLGGAEKVLQVMHNIFPDAPIYTLIYKAQEAKDVFEKSDYKIITSTLQKKSEYLKKHSRLLINYFPRAIEEFNLSEFDVVISCSNSFAHGVITKPSTLHICYCYSPTRYLWDWHHQYCLERNIGRSLISIKVRALLSNIRIWDYCAASRVDKWLAISKTVESRINKYYRVNSDVIYPPVDIDLIKPNGLPPEDFYLIVSRLSAYKKVDIAVEAFNQNGLKLVVVGEGGDSARLKKTAKTNIVFMGFQSDKRVIELMQKCKALIFPGEEDFGLTPVEAMAAGRPVVAFGRGGVTETVLSGMTGEFFEDETAESLNAALSKLNQNYQNYTPQKCAKRAVDFALTKFKQDFKNYIINAYSTFNLDK